MMKEPEEEKCGSCVLMKKRIEELEAELSELKMAQHSQNSSNDPRSNISNHQTKPSKTDAQLPDKMIATKKPPAFRKCELSNNEIERYSRQILLPEINSRGQKQLIESSALIVGIGGLGCPAALYLAASGVGCLGLVDYDDVDLSNLQRQTLHREDTQNMAKVKSAAMELKKINSSLNIDSYNTFLTSINVMEIIKKYDIILDCSDNVATRYMLNDACIKGGKILISGSALRWEGQLTVYNYDNGPCYRCLYPTPPPPKTVTNCSDGGVIGAITGIIGTLQALEAIKIVSGNRASYAGSLLLYDGLMGTFRKIKLRGKGEHCVCSINDTASLLLIDYEQFCGSKASDKDKECKLLEKMYRVPITYFHDAIKDNVKPFLLLDVRPKTEFNICSLLGSVNIPLSDILYKKDMTSIAKALGQNKEIFVLCKRGNESQKAVLEIKKYIENSGMQSSSGIKDVIGGLLAWSKKIDANFPVY